MTDLPYMNAIWEKTVNCNI